MNKITIDREKLITEFNEIPNLSFSKKLYESEFTDGRKFQIIVTLTVDEGEFIDD